MDCSEDCQWGAVHWQLELMILHVEILVFVFTSLVVPAFSGYLNYEIANFIGLIWAPIIILQFQLFAQNVATIDSH